MEPILNARKEEIFIPRHFSPPKKRSQAFVTIADYDSSVLDKFEYSHLHKSETVPDQSYTIAELLERHRAGLLTDTDSPPLWMDNSEEGVDDFDAPDLEKFQNMDLVDQQEIVDRYRETNRQYEKVMRDQAEQKRKDEEVENAKRILEREEAKKNVSSQTAEISEPRAERQVRDGAAAAGKKTKRGAE